LVLWDFGIFGRVCDGLVYIFKPSKKNTPVYTIETYTPLYTMKYHTVFQEMERIPLDDVRLHELQCLFIKEETEKGDTVIMCYSHDLEAFHYWCDSRSISFIELDTIAQLYTIVNQCKTVYRETEPIVVKKIQGRTPNLQWYRLKNIIVRKYTRRILNTIVLHGKGVYKNGRIQTCKGNGLRITD